MTEDWFREYMFRLVVDKKYVPENILKPKDEKPTMIPYDDPLFKAEE
jgi:bleomycin hydrolase